MKRSRCIRGNLATVPGTGCGRGSTATIGRDAQVLQVELRDLRERRRGDDAAEDRAARLVDHDEHDEPRLRRPAPCRRTTRRTCRSCSRSGPASARCRSCRRRCSRGSRPRCRSRRARRRRPSASSSARSSTAGATIAAPLEVAARRWPPIRSTRCGCDPDAAVRDRARTPTPSGSASPRCPARSARCRSSSPTTCRAAARARALAGEVDARSACRSRTARSSPSSADEPSFSAIVTAPTFDECERICATRQRLGRRAARRRGRRGRRPWIEYGSVNFVSGVTMPVRERAGDRHELERRARARTCR